ncbi:MAG: hypothetical protein AAGG69_11120 [Pseudomonadota bacterium]
MSSKKSPGRADRLRDQLRANLVRRKQQARARRDGEGDQREEGIPAVHEKSREAPRSEKPE